MVDKFRKIFFVFAIVAISLMGMPVHTAKAATLTAGTLIKASGAAVYYYASNGKRYVFPNEKTYKTWFNDFSSVVTITDAELAAIQIGGNIVYRPGTRLVKITTDPKVYAVSAHGTLHWITSETIANQLYGATWNQMIDDVSDAFFTNYTYGADITSAVHPDGAQIKYAGSSNIYVIEGGNKRLIADAAAYSANRFNSAYVMNIADTITYTSAATSLAAAETLYTDVAQLGGTTPVVTGNLNVTVASDTPASTTIPQGAVGVAVAKFTFSAGPNAVTINGLTLTRSGLGQATEIAKVYLYNGDAKLSSGRTINTSTNTVNFTNLNLNVPANGSVTVTVKVDVGVAGLGGTHRFGIAGVGDVSSTATVGGIFPVNTNEFAISTAVTVGKADVESNTATYTRKVGELQVEVTNFTVYVNNVENGKVESITLYNSGREIVSNLKLYRGTELVATGVQNGNYFTFNLTTPYEIAKSESAQFTVKGDISGREGDTATLDIRYKADVRVKGMTYGYALNIDNTLGADANSYVEEVDASPQSSTVTAEAGQLTAAFNGPVATEVAKNVNDVILMNFSLTAQAATDVEKTTINISGTNLVPADVDDLELVCNNVVLTEWATVTIGDNVSTDVWNLPAGGVNCQVRIDILNTAAGNETIKATLKNMISTAGNWTFKDAASGDALTDIVPSGDIAGNTMTVTAASLTVNLASSPASGNVYVPRTTGAEMVGFLMTAGAASDVKITSMKVAAYLDDIGVWDTTDTSGANDVLMTVKLYDELGNQLGSDETLVVNTTSNDITATFDNFTYTVPAGSTKKLLVKANISSTAPKTSNDDDVVIALDSIAAEYGTGGSALAATIINDNTAMNVVQTVTTNGVLTASLHADTPVAQILPMNSSKNVLRIKFAATKENITVNKLAINFNGSENSLVLTGDPDVLLVPTVLNATNVDFVDNTTGGTALAWDAGECVYNGAGAIVAIGDIRVNSCGPYAAGSVVAAGNSDIGATFVVGGDANIQPDAVFGDYYYDVDGSDTVTVGDIRVNETDSVNFVRQMIDEFAKVTINGQTAYFSNGIAKFSNLGINVPADSSTYVDAVVTVNGNTAADNYDGSNSFMSNFMLSAASFESQTATSGVISTTLTGGAVGNANYVFEAYPTFSVSTTGGALASNVDQVIGQFTVTANGAKDVTFVNGVSQIVLNINVAGATAGTSPTVKIKSGSELLCSGATDAVLVANGTVTFTCTFNNKDLTVGANSSKTLTVYLDTVAAGLANAADESASMGLNNTSGSIIWGIDGVGTYTDVAGTEIIDILLNGVLSGGTYSN